MVAASTAVARYQRGRLLGAELNTEVQKNLKNRVVEKAMLRLWELLNSRDAGVAMAVEARVSAALTEVQAEHVAAGRRKNNE